MATDAAGRTVKELKAQIVVGLGRENLELVSYLRDLPEKEWSGPTLCPEWDVKGVASHLVGQAEDFLDRQRSKTLQRMTKQPVDVMLPYMVAQNKRHYDEGRRVPIKDMIDRLQHLRGKVAARLAQIPNFAWRWFPVKGMVPMKLGQALAIQVVEAWVHRQDIQRPRGDSDGYGPFDVLVPAVLFGITKMRGYVPDQAVNIDLGDEGSWSIDPSGFHKGPAPGAVATVSIDPAELVLVAAGRMDADDAKTSIDGARGPGMELLYSARYMGTVPGL
jgi:uncharacterized protein (TIGR03083 family)